MPAYPGTNMWFLMFIFNVIFPVISINAISNFFRFGNSAWQFLGLIFGPGIFMVFIGSPRDIFGF